MTRIGRIKTWEIKDPASPRFRLVVEGGRVVLGCWRYVGDEDAAPHPDIAWETPRAIFERVS